MTSPAASPLTAPAPPAAKLEPDAIGVAQDTVIGMASAAPAVSVGITLAALTAATAYTGGPSILAVAGLVLVLHHAPGTYPVTARLRGMPVAGSACLISELAAGAAAKGSKSRA
jgi:hypothetical protein